SQVVVLLDRSASMLDRSLVEIIRLRLTSKQTRQKVEKWSTARKAAEWAFNRVKDQQTFQLLTFSDTVLDINGNVVAPSRQLSWLTKGAAGSELKNVRTMLDSVDANGPTNLERAFEAIATLRPSPKQVLLITDGLPTVPENVSLGRIRGCPNARTGQVPILSPQCRKNIFERSVQTFRSKLRDTSISVVLLPLDGDAQAMYSYWGLTARSRGRVLTPAEGWPW
ncbi:MAG: VWA domain-containing protein, partial [Gammaproteobacteria bacterium]|nr:VWA domain-containing protein [Gammaproteobacteria bacterium]